MSAESTLHYFDKETGKMISIPIDYEVKSHANDPCVVEAGRRATEFFRKHGFPHKLLNEIREKELIEKELREKKDPAK